MTKKVSPSDIRLAVEWLAANANGVSPIDWEPRSQTLLNAADEIDRLTKKCAALAFLLYGKLGESVPQQQRCVTLLLDYAVVAQEWTCRCDKLGGDLCMRCEVLEAIRSLRPAVATVNDPTTPPTYTVTP